MEINMGGVGKSSGNTSGSQGYSDSYITSKITVKNGNVFRFNTRYRA